MNIDLNLEEETRQNMNMEGETRPSSTRPGIPYNWNEPLMPGTIVCSTYNDFNNVQQTGLFCVLYDEQLDDNVYTRKNVLACKVSTQTTLSSNYSVHVTMDKNQFLDKPCIICCSKLHVLHKERNIYKVIGKLDVCTVKTIYKIYKRFVDNTERQLLDRI